MRLSRIPHSRGWLPTAATGRPRPSTRSRNGCRPGTSLNDDRYRVSTSRPIGPRPRSLQNSSAVSRPSTSLRCRSRTSSASTSGFSARITGNSKPSSGRVGRTITPCTSTTSRRSSRLRGRLASASRAAARCWRRRVALRPLPLGVRTRVATQATARPSTTTPKPRAAARAMLSHSGASVSLTVLEAPILTRGSPYENRHVAVEPSISGSASTGGSSCAASRVEEARASPESSSVTENRRPKESWGRPASAIRSSSGRPKGWPSKMSARAPSLKASIGGVGSMTTSNR